MIVALLIAVLIAFTIGANSVIADLKREVARLEYTLEKIRDRDWTENALDPQYAAELADFTLSRKDETDGR